MQIDTLQKYVVEVYSDQLGVDNKPWRTLGEFSELNYAIDACKWVVDDFLMRSPFQKSGAEFLINHFLNYGDVPCINGNQNLNTFDTYGYLSMKCNELAL